LNFTFSDLVDLLQYLFDVLFESHVEHNISFVKDQGFQTCKVYVSSIDVIDNTTSGSNKDVHSSFQLVCLISDTDSSVDCNHFEFFNRVLELGDLSSDLKG